MENMCICVSVCLCVSFAAGDAGSRGYVSPVVSHRRQVIGEKGLLVPPQFWLWSHIHHAVSQLHPGLSHCRCCARSHTLPVPDTHTHIQSNTHRVPNQLPLRLHSPFHILFLFNYSEVSGQVNPRSYSVTVCECVCVCVGQYKTSLLFRKATQRRCKHN